MVHAAFGEHRGMGILCLHAGKKEGQDTEKVFHLIHLPAEDLLDWEGEEKAGLRSRGPQGRDNQSCCRVGISEGD